MPHDRPIFDPVSELAEKYVQERKEDQLLPDDLEYAGHGGESVVFRVKQKEGKEGKFRRLVIKADMHYLKRGLMREAYTRWQAHPFATSDDARVRDGAKAMEQQEDDRARMEAAIGREEVFLKVLRCSFPSERLLSTRTVIRDVPVTQETAKEILERSDLVELALHATARIPTIVHYQEMIPERARMLRKEGGTNLDMHSFGFRYTERYDISLPDYQRLNRMVFGEREPFDAGLLYSFLHVGTVRLLEDSYKDQELADVLRELVHRMIQFTKTTNEMLDMAGGGNVRVYKNEEGKWTYLIVDPFADIEWTGARDAAQRLLHSSNIAFKTLSHFLNAINYARSLNGMAKILGIEDRINLVPYQGSDIDKQSESYLSLLRSRHHWPDKKIFSTSTAVLPATIKRPI